jgi:hypothetical protein
MQIREGRLEVSVWVAEDDIMIKDLIVFRATNRSKGKK